MFANDPDWDIAFVPFFQQQRQYYNRRILSSMATDNMHPVPIAETGVDHRNFHPSQADLKRRPGPSIKVMGLPEGMFAVVPGRLMEIPEPGWHFEDFSPFPEPKPAGGHVSLTDHGLTLSGVYLVDEPSDAGGHPTSIEEESEPGQPGVEE
jgi:hypothetical protein